MKIWKFSILFCLYSTLSLSQNQDMNFPEDWEGVWTGKLEIMNFSGKVQELPMELHILKSDTSNSYAYSIIYGENKEEGLRPYELLVIDAEKGVYLIDEHNSIKIESYFVDNKFLSWFEVQGSLIQTRSERIGDKLYYEIIAGSSQPVSTTGNTGEGEEKIPEVKTYPLKVVQKALLTRAE